MRTRFRRQIFLSTMLLTLVATSSQAMAGHINVDGKAIQTVTILGSDSGGFLGGLLEQAGFGTGDLTYQVTGLGTIEVTPNGTAPNGDPTFSLSNGVFTGLDGPFGPYQFGNLPGKTQDSDFYASLDHLTGVFTLGGSQFAFHLDVLDAALGVDTTMYTDPFTFTSPTLPAAGSTLTWSGDNQIGVYFGSQGGPLVGYSTDRTIEVISTSAVPEPTSIALLGIGGIGLGLSTYRKRRRQAKLAT